MTPVLSSVFLGAGDKYVLRLDVPVNKFEGMKMPQARSDLA